MKKSKNNISSWLKEHGNPEIDSSIEKNLVIIEKGRLTIESKEAERLMSKFESEIDMESATPYDPRNSNDLKHLAKCMAILHVELLIDLEGVHPISWVGVKEQLENM